MRRPPESKTTLWRRSRWGGRGCWVKSSRASFMGFSPFDSSAVRRERSSPRFTTVRYKEPSDRPCGRFSATLVPQKGAEGGTHHLNTHGIDLAEVLQAGGYSPECVEGMVCELPLYGVLTNSPPELPPGIQR